LVILLAFCLVGIGIWRFGSSEGTSREGLGPWGPEEGLAGGGESQPEDSSQSEDPSQGEGDSGGLGDEGKAEADPRGAPVAEGPGGQASDGRGGTSSWHSDLSLTDQARGMLLAYQERGDCVLAHADYLDLMGRTWGCVVQGEGWVEICLVQEASSGGSDVHVTELSASDWEGELDGLAGGS